MRRLFLLTLLGLWAIDAAAVPVTVEFSGTIDTAGPSLSPVIQPGDSFSGVYIFESDTPAPP